MANYKPGQSGKSGKYTLLQALKKLIIGDSDNKNTDTEKRLRAYDKHTKKNNTVKSNKTSQDRFQWQLYRKQETPKPKYTKRIPKQQPIKTINGNQLQEVVVTAKQPVKKQQTVRNSNRASKTTQRPSTNRRNYRSHKTEEELSLLNNPNYVEDASTRGIRFVPELPDDYYDIEGRTPSQQLLYAASVRDRARNALVQQMLDVPTISNMDGLYNEFSAPDEYNRGKNGYWW